jgi:hypothetical protein
VDALVSHADADPISRPGCDGVVEVCTMKAVQEKLGFGRNSLVGTNISDIGRFDYAQALVDRPSPNAYCLTLKLDCSWL